MVGKKKKEQKRLRLNNHANVYEIKLKLSKILLIKDKKDKESKILKEKKANIKVIQFHLRYYYNKSFSPL